MSSLTLTSADSPITLVNSIYPLEYFSLSGVNQIKQPDNFWWSSKQRYASIDSSGSYLSGANGGTATSEILEIDLGRIREINYFNFDLLRAPIDITIEFDAISSPNRTPTWRPVQQIPDLPFEDGTRFEPDNRNAWHNLEFHFTDEFGNMVHARYFRFTFTRRDEAWPTDSSPAFPWAIFVKHMRPGRYIAGLLDTVGPLLTQDTPNTLVGQTLATDFGNTSYEIRQQFTIPTTAVRAGQTPNLLGFGVLVNPVGTDITASDNQIELAWSLYDTTLSHPTYADMVLNHNPELYWRMGELTGTTAVDSSGNGNDGTYNSGVTLGQPGAIAGDSSTSVLFDNTTSAKITSLYSPFTVGSQRTFMGWAYRNATTDADQLFGSDGVNPAMLRLEPGSEDVKFWAETSTGGGLWSAAWPGTSQWVHWALTYDDSTSTAELFINGTSQGSKTTGDVFSGSSGHIVVGGPYSSSFFNGYMQDFAIFESILSATDIAAIYAESSVPPSAPIKLSAGTIGPLTVTTERWLDVYLDETQMIAGDTSKVYEFRVSSLNTLTCNTVYTHAPNGLSATSIPGTLTFTNGSSTITTSQDLTSVLAPGEFVIRTDTPEQPLLVEAVTASDFTTSDTYTGTSTTTTGSIIYPRTYWNGSAYVQDASSALVMRVWADIADEGQDVLGNEYRYVVRSNPAVDVLTNTKAGWMSDPMPTPEAVEALYFDTRSIDTNGEEEYTVMEALEIAPRTPGVTMNVYYSQENLHGERPVTTEDWDNLVWASIPKTYTLRRHEIIRFPHPIRAAFMKLEFSALQPLPYNLPSFPPLPPKVYRRFPTWVEDQFQNAKLKNLVEDWFLRNSTPIEQKVLSSLADPVLEFENKEREFISALALGTITDEQVVNSSLVSVADKALIDPTTGDKIYVQTPDQYGSPMLSTVDQNGSILGQVMAGKFDSTKLTVPTESQQTPTLGNQIPVVSTINDRVAHSFQSMAQIPMRFNKTVRHIYVKEQALFNKKAYFVGIDKVKFLRIDYTSQFDDDLIVDNLYDDTMMIENTWGREAETSITDGQAVYVSYQVGDTTVTDEEVVLPGFASVALQVVGAPARNVLVFQSPNQQGIQYFQNQDYQLGYSTDANGNRVALIERTALSNRLSVPLQPVVYQDVFTVVGKGNMPQRFFDAATVVSVGVVTCFEFFGTGYIDSGTVVGTGVVTGAEVFEPLVHYGDNTYGTGEYGANPQ